MLERLVVYREGDYLCFRRREAMLRCTGGRKRLWPLCWRTCLLSATDVIDTTNELSLLLHIQYVCLPGLQQPCASSSPLNNGVV